MNVCAALGELATLGATPGGIDRALFTPAEHAARERFAAWARACGARVEQDRTGNLFARREGRAAGAPPVLCGSHLDTVKDGGAYDGAYGVVAGLAALTAHAGQAAQTERALEIVAWAGEEGSRFPVGTLGSAAYADLMPYEVIAELCASDGERFADAFAGPCGALAGVPVRAASGGPGLAAGGGAVANGPPAAYAELHVEQGPVLERSGAHLGIVTAIAGQRRFSVEVRGEAGHAGTVPMGERADALAAASELVLRTERIALDAGECVATVGRIVVEPNQTNVVPGAASLRIDVRSSREATIEAVSASLRDACAEIASARGVRVELAETERRAAVAMDAALTEIVGAVCLALDPRAIPIVSGAGHDAMCVARIAPAAMIFVPSTGGRSHVGAEHTAPGDLELGARALAETLRAIDRHVAKS